ncbi:MULTISPECIES: hypothetical protein [Priestia]|nr:hypothetical protein [Priestia megaterium]
MLQEEPSTVERAKVIATLSNIIIKAIEAGELDALIKVMEKRFKER